jgi:hypothetical protein
MALLRFPGFLLYSAPFIHIIGGINMTLFRVTGFTLIAIPIAFNLIFFALQRAFEYPDILRKPIPYIMEHFVAGGSRLIRLWYAFAVTSLLFIPLSILTGAVFNREHPFLALTSIILGVLAGLVQGLGLLRWTFLVPGLAQIYQDSSASPATRDAVAVTFQAFHQYIGTAVGEHLGYIFTASWTIVLSLLIAQSPMFSPIFGLIGVVLAIGIFLGVFEQAGWKPAAAVNAISYVGWSVWLIVAGVTLLLAQVAS